jgi:hypothetical protein
MPMYELFVPKLLITTFGSPETGCYWTTLWNSDILEMGFLVGFFQLNLVGFSCPALEPNATTSLVYKLFPIAKSIQKRL